MIMTGVNGTKINTKKSILIYDFSISIETLKKFIISKTIEVIPLNFQCYQKLLENNISCESPDKFLTTAEMNKIQQVSYELSDWYSEKEFLKILQYKNVNLGSLIQAEFINILVNFIREFQLIAKISKNISYSIACSSKVGNIVGQFTKNYKLVETNTNHINLPLDSVNTNYELKILGKKFEFRIGKKRLDSIKSISETFSNSLISSSKNNDSKFFLFSEINTKKYSNLLHEMSNYDENYILYNRRIPTIWDRESLNIIKNSKIIIENEKTIKQKIDSKTKNSKFDVNRIIIELKNHSDIFQKKFQISGISFWNNFKENFFNLIEKRFLNYTYEIDLSSKLLEKYSFDGIIVQNEIGPNEKILLSLGKLKKIPILLLQHGLIFDTDEAFTMNKYQGILGINSDYQLVWGNIDYQYRKKFSSDIEKIIKVGSPIYDKLNSVNNSKRDYILLATSGPTREDIFDLTIETNLKNIDTIKKISEIIKKLNLKLIIKIHPSPDEYDPSDLVKKIDKNIQVVKTGNISELIKNCSLIIIIDFSSVILDAYLLQKPIISIPVKNNGYGIPTAFKNGSCLISKLENLERNLKNILSMNNTQQIQNEIISSELYLSNQGYSSKKLLDFLSKFK